MSDMSKQAEVHELRGSGDGSETPSSQEGDAMKHGTANDQADMIRLGKQQQLKRSFHSVSIFGLTCVIMATWEAMFSTGTFSLINGGRAGTVWIFIATWFMTIPVTASLAEMASMAPSSGGQYHWVSEFAPPSLQKILSYCSGWLAAMGWQAFIASTSYTTAQQIFIIATVHNPNFQPTPWQSCLFTIGIALFAALFNAFLAKRLPMFEGVVLFCHLLGFFAVMIPLWVLAPKVSLDLVFGAPGFENFGGWSSIGAACVVGQLAASSAFVGVDSAAHMAEEVKNASITVPRMMLGTTLINGALGLVVTITYMLVIQDVEQQILGSSSAYPWIEVFEAATGSKAAAVGMSIPFILITLGMAINSTAAASRQAWSFARDGGLPFPNWFCRLVKIDGVPLPLNAIGASMFLVIILALLCLGGDQVFNSIMGLLNGAVGLTYVLSIACVLWRRLFGEPLPPARWSLGKLGVPLNIIAVCYQSFTTIISFFPLFAVVTPADFNWGIAMFALVVIIAVSNYFIFGKKMYAGPVVSIIKDA